MRRGLYALLALAAAACAAPLAPTLPAAPVAAGPAIAIASAPVALDPNDPARTAVGAFRYAGGLVLTAADTSRLHGLSDVRITPDGALSAVSDDGDFLKARIVLSPEGRLIGVTDGRLAPLSDLAGKPLQDKVDADAEGLAVLANGDRLISFEQRHRIWLYPADGGPPRAVPSPIADFPDNGGMEALAADPAAGPDAYVVGGEESGETWTCRIAAACVAGPSVPLAPGFALVALTRLEGGRTAYLLRAWDRVRGSRISLSIAGPQGEIDRLDLTPPMTVDNFEGLTALGLADGSIRFYLMSDDNFSAAQRTMLLAFDWRPKS